MRPTIVLSCLVLFAAGAGSAEAQEPAADSAVYAVKYRKAKELAGLLERQFKGTADLRVVEDAATNQVLLNGPKNQVEASLKVLAQLDRKPLTIAVEAFLFVAAEEKTPDGKIVQALTPKDFTGPAETIAAKIQTLKEQKHISELQRIQVTAQEHQRGNVKQMEQKPVVRGKTVTATGIVTESRTIVNIGVIMDVTPRLTPERDVMLDLTLEWSRLNAQPDGTAYTSASSFSGPVTVSTGQAVLVRAVKTTAPLKDGQSFVVITAKIVP